MYSGASSYARNGTMQAENGQVTYKFVKKWGPLVLPGFYVHAPTKNIKSIQSISTSTNNNLLSAFDSDLVKQELTYHLFEY